MDGHLVDECRRPENRQSGVHCRGVPFVWTIQQAVRPPGGIRTRVDHWSIAPTRRSPWMSEGWPENRRSGVRCQGLTPLSGHNERPDGLPMGLEPTEMPDRRNAPSRRPPSWVVSSGDQDAVSVPCYSVLPGRSFARTPESWRRGRRPTWPGRVQSGNEVSRHLDDILAKDRLEDSVERCPNLDSLAVLAGCSKVRHRSTNTPSGNRTRRSGSKGPRVVQLHQGSTPAVVLPLDSEDCSTTLPPRLEGPDGIRTRYRAVKSRVPVLIGSRPTDLGWC